MAIMTGNNHIIFCNRIVRQKLSLCGITYLLNIKYLSSQQKTVKIPKHIIKAGGQIKHTPALNRTNRYMLEYLFDRSICMFQQYRLAQAWVTGMEFFYIWWRLQCFRPCRWSKQMRKNDTNGFVTSRKNISNKYSQKLSGNL